MAIDTEDKRRSAISTMPGIRILPVADGAIIQADWQHTAKIYRGIAAGAGSPAVLGPYVVAQVDSFTAGPVKMDAFSAGPATQKMDTFTSGPVASEDK